ncbi:MAG: DUF2892 domain-containing protein [Rhodanobacteraceae bacterium]|nr:MAG: DUF2892 domain-containing protein [Rhodanobacteraceae bacterium]
MNIDRLVVRFAGSMVIASVVLAHFFTPWWLLLALFVGVNLLQSSFTGFCPLARILRKLGSQPGCAFPSRPHPSREEA